jgi:hypothetical protein
MSDESALHEAPLEFINSLAEVTGYCEAQSILPVNGRYVGHCTCGGWDVVVDGHDECLALARKHTAETASRA